MAGSSDEFPSTSVDQSVVVSAQEDEVAEVTRSSIGPMSDVVGVAPGCRTCASRPTAVAVAHPESSPLGGTDGARAAAEVEDLTVGAGDEPAHNCITGQPPGGGRVDDSLVQEF